MENCYYYDTEIGRIGIGQEGDAITDVFFGERPGAGMRETPLIKRAAKQLQEYLAGERKEFDLPLAPKGTDFQKMTWKALLTIPYGETISYKQLAEKTGNPKACRAVGGANNKNPIAILIPCHRVVGSDGSLTGYAGGLPMKQALLNLESESL